MTSRLRRVVARLGNGGPGEGQTEHRVQLHVDGEYAALTDDGRRRRPSSEQRGPGAGAQWSTMHPSSLIPTNRNGPPHMRAYTAFAWVFPQWIVNESLERGRAVVTPACQKSNPLKGVPLPQRARSFRRAITQNGAIPGGHRHRLMSAVSRPSLFVLVLWQ